uniref:Toll-like receptor 13 n=1 Tax=Crassostrea virginica TaxID=6565 RepID=A0A8B8CCT1_CRAVI|nr:toll-like receptor 13 [Crassostrea virginica]
MTEEITFFFLLVAGLAKVSFALSCSSELRCKCSYVNNMLTADCNHLHLKKPPIFNKDVRRIDLSNNHFFEIPINMPSDIIFLNLENNKIKYPQKSTLAQYKHLKVLRLNDNCLWEGLKIWPSRFFENLTKLEFLSIRDNCPGIDEIHMMYPHEGFYGLSSLKNIEVNGLGQGNFGDAFEKNNSIEILRIPEESACQIHNIKKDTLSVFKKATNITLFNCHFKYIEKGAFATLTELVYLDITKNTDLSLSVLSNITYDLRNSKIKTLVANKLQCSNGLSLVLKIKHLINLQNTTLTELSLAGNTIALIEHKLMTYLPKSLTYLNVEDNVFIFGMYLYEGDFLSNLERLDIRHAGYYRPDYEISCNYNSDNCDQNEETPHTTQSEVATSSQNQTYQIPPKLKYLNIANQRISFPTDLKHGVRISSRNSLTHLYASGNIFDYIPSFVLSGLQHLQHADLSNNFCSNITRESFRDLNMLSLLNLSRNLLGGILKNQGSSDLFKFLPKLKILDLSNNLITYMPEKLFSFTKNIAILNLSNNEIETISFDLTSALELQEIDLSFNKIMKLDLDSMQKLEARRKIPLAINMANNSFTCNCKSLDFLRWIKESSNKQFLYIDTYECSFENGTNTLLKELEQIIASLEQDCRSYTTTVVIACILFTLTVFVVCLGIGYRYRWELRYIYYAGKRWLSAKDDRLLEIGGKYHFDVFVSYAESERQMFIPNLRLLEENLDLRFCIHSRDFMPGVTIHENITNAIHYSKQTVCFVSKAFLKSEYCMYELQMAKMEGITRGTEDALLIVLVDGDIEDLHRVVNTNRVYLEYNKDHPEEFWNAFEHALKEMSS